MGNSRVPADRSDSPNATRHRASAASGRSFSDFPTITESIRSRLLVLDPSTAAHTGHGDSTTTGDEAPHLEEWIARGH